MTLTAWGQESPEHPPPPPRNVSGGANLLDFFSSKTPYEFWLTCLIILFGLTVIFMLFVGLRRLPADRRPEDFSRALIVVTVVTAALILITAGYSDRQAAPAFGLLGTIVGYILGRMGQVRPDLVNAQSNEPNPQSRDLTGTEHERQSRGD